MRVSVLVSFHNHERFVQRVAESALAQDFDDYEVVFVDDASTDGSFRVLQQTVADYRGFRGRRVVCLRNESNLGIVGTFNRLMSESSGELCVVHCGDDIAHPNRVSEIVRCWDEAVRGRPNVVAAMTRCRLVDGDFRVMSPTVSDEPYGWRVVSGDSVWNCGFTFHGAAAVYSRSLYDRFGMMDPAAKFEDGLMFFRMVLAGDLLLINERLFDYRSVEGASTTYHADLQTMANAAVRDVNTIRQQLLDLTTAEQTAGVRDRERFGKYREALDRWLHWQKLFVSLMIGRGKERRMAIREVICASSSDRSMRRILVFALPRPVVRLIVWLRGTWGNLRWRSRIRRLEGYLDFSGGAA